MKDRNYLTKYLEEMYGGKSKELKALTEEAKCFRLNIDVMHSFSKFPPAKSQAYNRTKHFISKSRPINDDYVTDKTKFLKHLGNFVGIENIEDIKKYTLDLAAKPISYRFYEKTNPNMRDIVKCMIRESLIREKTSIVFYVSNLVDSRAIVDDEYVKRSEKLICLLYVGALANDISFNFEHLFTPIFEFFDCIDYIVQNNLQIFSNNVMGKAIRKIFLSKDSYWIKLMKYTELILRHANQFTHMSDMFTYNYIHIMKTSHESTLHSTGLTKITMLLWHGLCMIRKNFNQHSLQQSDIVCTHIARQICVSCKYVICDHLNPRLTCLYCFNCNITTHGSCLTDVFEEITRLIYFVALSFISSNSDNKKKYTMDEILNYPEMPSQEFIEKKIRSSGREWKDYSIKWYIIIKDTYIIESIEDFKFVYKCLHIKEKIDQNDTELKSG